MNGFNEAAGVTRGRRYLPNGCVRVGYVLQ